jgi:hypothetical protein
MYCIMVIYTGWLKCLRAQDYKKNTQKDFKTGLYIYIYVLYNGDIYMVIKMSVHMITKKTDKYFKTGLYMCIV